MRLFLSAVASVAALGLPLVGGSGPTRATTIVRAPRAFVTPDFFRTKAYFVNMCCGQKPLAIPKLNGLSGFLMYDSGSSHYIVKIWTGWGTYGSPPPPSNGGTVVAYLQMHFPFESPAFGSVSSPSSITYSRLNPSKSYSFDVWDVTNTPSEVKVLQAGSPSSGVLTCGSPLANLIVNGAYVALDVELVQNP